jgi:anaerobic ribonucleoside-triphosphate reductase activating protein
VPEYRTENPELNVAAWQPHCSAAGPGDRFVLWLQGCPMRCPGCVNPEFQPFVPRAMESAGAVAERILGAPGIHGVTYSGGEPMEQAPGLAVLSERLRSRGLTVVCYTGYTLDHLRRRGDPAIERFLRSIDLLIDGPYMREHPTKLMWRGSSNQKAHFLSEAFHEFAVGPDRAEAHTELAVGGASLSATGIWPEGFFERLTEALKR